MVKDKFSLKELEKLIKICKKQGVSELKHGDFQISFDVPDKASNTPIALAGGSKKTKEVTEQAHLQEEFNSARDQIDTLHVENPLAYEEALYRGELGEEKNH